MTALDTTEVFFSFFIITLILLSLAIFVIYFLRLFQRRQLQNLQEKATLQSQFAQEILTSQIEVQNATLQQIGQELHDNIGQLLSVARINLNILEETKQEGDNQEYIKQTNEIIGQSIHDLRALTKSLDGDFVAHFGLQESIAFELQRIRKTNKFETEITINGEPYTLGYEREIILFRIFQEFLNNTLKHAGAKHIKIMMDYLKPNLILLFSDDGKGFDFENTLNTTLKGSGAGLRNMQRRCELIGATCTFDTAIGMGTRINIKIPATEIAAGNA